MLLRFIVFYYYYYITLHESLLRFYYIHVLNFLILYTTLYNGIFTTSITITYYPMSAIKK